MSDYTKINLREDVEDSAVAYGTSPDIEARFARAVLGLRQAGLSYQRLAPGYRLPWGHHHRRQEEVYVVLSGGGRAKLADDVVDLAPLDALRVPPETMRGFEAGPDGLELIAFGAPHTGPTDASVADDIEMAPGWWSD
jgi:uncharacterized cupin superfamily protein